MTAENEGIGTELFGRFYFPPTSLSSDSKRFRFRLGAQLDELMYDPLDPSVFVTHVQREIGVPIPATLRGPGRMMSSFIATCSIVDLMDTITLVYEVLLGYSATRATQAKRWFSFVTRAIREEGLAYRLTDDCAVRHLVDAEFEKAHEAAIAGLGAESLTAVRDLVDRAFEDFTGPTHDMRLAVRHMFDAVETLVKRTLNTNQDLDTRLVQSELMAYIQRALGSSDQFVKAFATSMVSSFSKWVAAGHKYRHGANADTVVAPTPELAVLFLSQGAGFIRWIAGITPAAPSGEGASGHLEHRAIGPAL